MYPPVSMRTRPVHGSRRQFSRAAPQVEKSPRQTASAKRLPSGPASPGLTLLPDVLEAVRNSAVGAPTENGYQLTVVPTEATAAPVPRRPARWPRARWQPKEMDCPDERRWVRRGISRRTGELNGSLSDSARFTLLLADYGKRSIFRRESVIFTLRGNRCAIIVGALSQKFRQTPYESINSLTGRRSQRLSVHNQLRGSASFTLLLRDYGKR
jgi:hypothetical protein